MGSGSVGLQIGGKVSEIVFIIRTEKGLQALLDHKFKFGAEAGVTMVAVGIGLEGASTAAGGADIVAFANSAGLFAGASIEGSYLDADNDWNALYYGQGATAKASSSTAASPIPAPSRSGSICRSGSRRRLSEPLGGAVALELRRLCAVRVRLRALGRLAQDDV